MNIRDVFHRRKFAFAIELDRQNWIGGWIFLRGVPRRRLLVCLKLEQHVIATARADTYRADVRRAVAGHDGYCGFAFPTDGYARSDLKLDVVRPRCTIGSGLPAGVRRGETMVRHSDFVLCLDRTDVGLSGWVVSPRDPEKRFRLLVRVAGDVWAEQTACLFRSDGPKWHDDPFHGFSIVLPSVHSEIEIVDAETSRRMYKTGSRS